MKRRRFIPYMHMWLDLQIVTRYEYTNSHEKGQELWAELANTTTIICVYYQFTIIEFRQPTTKQ